METLSKIFEVLNNKISLPVTIFCALLLFIPDFLLERLDLKTFTTSNKTVISLIFLFSILLYGYEKSKTFFIFLKNKYISRRKNETLRETIIKRLEGLTIQEEAWIFYCLKQNTRTLIATAINSTAISLENKFILYSPNTQHDILATPFTFHSDVWDYLVKNKDKYCSNDRLNDLQYNAEVNDFIRSLRSAFSG